MIDKQRLIKKAAGYNIHISPQTALKLAQYDELLEQWNQKINLTALKEPQQVEDRHFIDSLLLANQPEVAGSLVDVGSGAGFPGMVAKLYKPRLAVTLMEPTGKRVNFLQALATELGVEVECLKERAEEAARKRWRESFDVAVARAVAALPVLCEYCLPLVKPGGWMIAMKGEAALQEIKQAANAIQKLGGALFEAREFSLPDGSARSLVLIKKVGQAPAVYPRQGGKIAKAPL